MALPLTDKGEEFVGMLPRHIRDAPSFQKVLDVKAREFERIEDAIDDIILNSFYQTATWGLALFELEYGLPVEPSGVSDADRRTLIALKYASVFGRVGVDFKSIVEAAAPGSVVTMNYNTSEVEIKMPLAVDAAIETQLEVVLREIVPAHLDLNVQYSTFIAGVAKAGDSL
jgi:hypothetical protein